MVTNNDSCKSLRVSLFGGGTDFKEFIVLTEVLYSDGDKQVCLHNNQKDLIQISIFIGQKNLQNVNEIEHDLIREFKKANIRDGVEIICLSDVPGSGTGLGSSSSFTVAALNAAFTYNGVQKSSMELAKIASEIEIDILKNQLVFRINIFQLLAVFN